MANHNHSGGREAGPPDDQPESWRPQDRAPMRNRGRDEDDRSWRDRGYRDDDRRMSERDPRRWEGSRGSELGNHEDREPGSRSTERYGQGQSGYGAGRHGEDRSLRVQNRSDLGGFEDRHHDELGVDDRFTGRGHRGYWLDRPARDDAARLGRSPDESAGELAASQRRTGYSAYGQTYAQGQRGYGQRQATQDDVHRSGGHTHHGTGPHRGRGPAGYQRSDERIREAVCESLTEDDEIDATRVEVSVRGGEVTLTGVVEDRRAKRDAEDCAYSVSGVRDVQNLLCIRDDDRSSRTSSSPHGNHGHGSHGAVGSDVEMTQDGRKPRA